MPTFTIQLKHITMTTAKITFRNYRSHLLLTAAKTGDHALANLASTATTAVLRNLFEAGYKLPAAAEKLQNAELSTPYYKCLLIRQANGTVIDEMGTVYEVHMSDRMNDCLALYAANQKIEITYWHELHPAVQALFK